LQYHGIETVTVQEGEPRCCVIDKDTVGCSEETESGRDVRKGSETRCRGMVDVESAGVFRLGESSLLSRYLRPRLTSIVTAIGTGSTMLLTCSLCPQAAITTRLLMGNV
jgi:hypothetical protein